VLESLYKQIDKLKGGVEISCDGCGEIFKFYEFPFNSVKLCFNCWETKHDKTLHKKRLRKLEKVVEAKSLQKFGVNFNYDELIDEFDDYRIYNKLKNKKPKSQVKKSARIKTTKTQDVDFRRENDLTIIKSYLENQKVNDDPIKFWYRDDVEPREIYDYHIDDKYINVRSDEGYFIKFLIDKIRKI